jgi:hypothetical protein
MRLSDHTSGGPLGLAFVSVANWSTRIPRRAPESHIDWTESRGTLSFFRNARGLSWRPSGTGQGLRALQGVSELRAERGQEMAARPG